MLIPDADEMVRTRLKAKISPRLALARVHTKWGVTKDSAGAALGPFCRVLARFGRFFRTFGEKPKTPSPGNRTHDCPCI